MQAGDAAAWCGRRLSADAAQPLRLEAVAAAATPGPVSAVCVSEWHSFFERHSCPSAVPGHVSYPCFLRPLQSPEFTAASSPATSAKQPFTVASSFAQCTQQGAVTCFRLQPAGPKPRLALLRRLTTPGRESHDAYSGPEPTRGPWPEPSSFLWSCLMGAACPHQGRARASILRRCRRPCHKCRRRGSSSIWVQKLACTSFRPYCRHVMTS